MYVHSISITIPVLTLFKLDVYLTRITNTLVTWNPCARRYLHADSLQNF
jgi:hypothetical protein